MFDNNEFRIDSSLAQLNNASKSLNNNSLNSLQPDEKGFGSRQLLTLAGETLIHAWQNQTNPIPAIVYAAGSIFKSNFAVNSHIAFGEAFDVKKAEALGADILGGDYGVLPNIQFLSNAEMNGALGAYAKSNNTIYVNSVFLKENSANPTAVGKVLIEESGHFLDVYASPVDSPGDEGEMLADLIAGDQLSADQITRIRAEDDSATIVVNGQKLGIEQSSLASTISISATDANAGETLVGKPINPGQFTFTRTGSIASALTVNYTVRGTATNGIDYSTLGNSITFAAGASTTVINLNPIDDFVIENDETVILSLATSTNYNLGTATTATVIIADNDKPIIDWFSLNLKDEQIRTLARDLASDRDLSRRDMLNIFESAKDFSIIDSNESSDIKVLVNNFSGTPFSIQEPVRWLARKVAAGALSNMSASQFQSDLVDRWFLGKVAPTARFDRITNGTITRYDLTYVEVKGNLFDISGQAKIGDIDQGYLGDCAFLAALGATFGRQFGDVDNAVSSVINNMIINNNDNTYTMKFFRNGVAEYFTVDNRLATWNGSLFTSRNNNYLLNPNNPSVPLWMPLVQKAYAQWRESWGNGQTGYTIVGNGADPFDTLSYITGRKVTGGYGSNFTFSTLDNALRNGQVIVTARLSDSTDIIVGGHAYSVTNVYIAANGQQRVIVRNPWGVDNYWWKQKSGADDGFIDLSFDDFRRQMDYGVSIA